MLTTWIVPCLAGVRICQIRGWMSFCDKWSEYKSETSKRSVMILLMSELTINIFHRLLLSEHTILISTVNFDSGTYHQFPHKIETRRSRCKSIHHHCHRYMPSLLAGSHSCPDHRTRTHTRDQWNYNKIHSPISKEKILEILQASKCNYILICLHTLKSPICWHINNWFLAC